MSMIGKSLAHYEITSQIGKGGMGEVYQAKDTKLGRDVAIKVLPEEFALDPDRVARFQREAKLLASLNHPNIAAIYGLEDSDGIHFLVMELIEGQNLSDRIKTGPIPVEEALKLALQIAEALEAAHEKGVIHRDLKPANIKITPDGKLKVLDFGLAKAFAGEQADMNLSNSPTLSLAATRKGIILGTAAYMSPEQARGKPVDTRADIWAFGVVLFEMLTGRLLFAGEDVSSTLARVLERDPDFSMLPPNLHPRIRLLLERCLKKEPKSRYSGISDGRVDIQEVLADPAGVLFQDAVGTERRSRRRTVFPWASAVLFAIIAGALAWDMRTPRHPEVIQFTYNLPESQHFGSIEERAIAISPDGSRFVYQTEEGLYVRPMAKTDAKLIRGTQGAQKPFFSPDGRWIGYISGANKDLRKVPVDEGGSVPIANVNSIGFLSWGKDGAIVYADNAARKIMKVSAGSGEPEVVIETERECFAPQILPDGKTVMYTITGSPYKIVAQSIGSSEAKEVTSGDSAQYLSSGHIVYAEDSNLYAVAFDPDKLEVTGSRALIVEGVMRAAGAPHYAVSDSGTLVYVPGASLSSQVRLEWYDRQGNPVGSVGEPGQYRQLALSLDGEKIIIEKLVSGNGYDLWMLDLSRAGSDIPVVNGPYTDEDPVWSPKGDYIAYDSNPKGSSALYRKSMAAEEEDVLLLEPKEGNLYAEDWSRDGRYIAYLEVSNGEKIYRLPLSGEPTPEFLVGGPYNYDEPKFSPDGKTLAYVSSESGRDEIWIKPLEGNGRPLKVSSNGGGQPLWRNDGKELFFLALDGTIMAVDMGEDSSTPGLPKPLFQTSIYVDPTIDQYAVTGDGQKFLILNRQGSDISSINVIVNWYEGLKQRGAVE